MSERSDAQPKLGMGSNTRFSLRRQVAGLRRLTRGWAARRERLSREYRSDLARDNFEGRQADEYIREHLFTRDDPPSAA